MTARVAPAKRTAFTQASHIGAHATACGDVVYSARPAGLRGVAGEAGRAYPIRDRRTSAGRGGTIPAVKLPLPVPPPYDFERSMFRFRLFGDDLASRWLAGGLHRVLDSGLAVRIDAGGVTGYGSFSDDDRDELHHLLGGGFDLAGFAAAHPDLAARAPGFRPPLLRDPFEMLVTAVTAQQISLRAAAVMRRSWCGGWAVGSATTAPNGGGFPASGRCAAPIWPG